MAEKHPRLRLDDNFASPIRFSLMAALIAFQTVASFVTLPFVLLVGSAVLV